MNHTAPSCAVPLCGDSADDPFSQPECLLTSELKNLLLWAVRNGRTYLMEHESKEILEGIGVPTTGFRIARSEKEALAFTAEAGYPVALKIVSPDVVHKTDRGGVKLGLDNSTAVRMAYWELLDTFKNHTIEGVTVQNMAKQGIEAIVGVTRDPVFGPLIMFGLGGVFVEVLRDVAFRILPITGSDAEEMIHEIRGAEILQGYRGQAVDLESLKGLLVKVSRLVVQNPEIRELDINPLFLYPDGYVTVDARMFVGKPPERKQTTLTGHASLRDFFYPKSIAVIGASDVNGKLGYNVFRNLLCHEFPGRLYPVNPGKDRVLGIKAYTSILDVDEPVDLAIVIVPAQAVESAIGECCSKGVRYAVIESAGFAESGQDGLAVQERIMKLACNHGCRILGPNCSGVINTHHRMVQSIGLLPELRSGNVGLIAQAGVYAAGILTGLSKVLDFGIVATIGNKMDLNETDILEYFSDDDRISVIIMYMEDVRSGKRFVDVASRTALRKPVIVLKSGRTDAGKKAVASHTASLAGNDDVNSTAFKQSGLIRARDNDHLFALADGFSKQPMPQGNGILVITYTGSFGVAATDMLYLTGMRLAALEPYLQEQARRILPGYVNMGNPIDCSFTMTPDQVKHLVEIGLLSSDVSGIIVVLQGELLGSFVDSLKEIDSPEKPLFCCVACKEFMMHDVVKMEEAGFPVYSTPEMACDVMSRMYHYGIRRNSTMAESVARHLTRQTLSVDNAPVRLRLIKPGDMQLWTDFVSSCSERSLWLRFLAPFHPTPERARKFCNINADEEMAVVAEMNEGNRRQFLGIGRLIKNSRREGEVEYAVIVSDPWQNKSLGYTLFEQCIELARKKGYRTMLAETLQENYPIMRICRHYNFTVTGRDDTMVTMMLNLARPVA